MKKNEGVKVAIVTFRIKPNRHHSIYIRRRSKMFAPAKDEYVSKTKSILILGKQGAGKSRNLNKLLDHKEKIWKKRKFIIFKSTDAIGEILHKNLTEEEKEKFYEENNIDQKLRNKQYILIEILKEKAKEAIIIVDDIDQFSGKKLEVLKDLIRETKQFIATAESEKSIDKTLMRDLEKKNFVKMQLPTKAAYDATYILFAIFLIFLVATNNLELAALVMVGRYMMKDLK